jgi:hypothetical protein
LKNFRSSSFDHESREDQRYLFSCTSIINGEEVMSAVEIIMRVPERRIAWHAISDNFRVGVVVFDPLPGGATRVTVKVRSIAEPVLLTRALRDYLRNSAARRTQLAQNRSEAQTPTAGNSCLTNHHGLRLQSSTDYRRFPKDFRGRNLACFSRVRIYKACLELQPRAFCGFSCSDPGERVLNDETRIGGNANFSPARR